MYEAATKAYQYMQFEKCLEYADEALNRDEQFIEVYLFKAQVLNRLERHREEAEAYVKALAIDELFFKYALLNSAKAHYRIGKYEVALKHANNFLKVPKLEARDKKNGRHLVKQIKFAQKSVANPVKIDPQPIDNYINRVGDVYWPSMPVDNSRFYFTVKLPLYRSSFQEDIYVSIMRNDSFGKPFPLNNEVLSLYNEGASFISPDGRYLFFTGCKRNDGYGSCDLYMSLKRDGKWHTPVNLGSTVNSKYWESRPVISSDGQTLYFSSNRKGGKGNADIYLCKNKGVNDAGYPIWGPPINLGDSINTSGDEFAPFIHADNQTLYFSSNHHLGLGGQDIFMSKKIGENKWTKPKNLGYPINQYKDEIGLFIDAPGKYAYFASDNQEGRRSIYRFEVPQSIKPQYVSYIKIFVKDKITFEPLSANVNLFDVETGENIVDILAEGAEGSALVSLPGNRKYGLMVEKKGYMFYSDHFDLKKKEKDFVQNLTIKLQPIQKGMTVVLKNVFYKFDSYELSEESKSELNRVKRFLKQNGNLHVEISGHTDNQGSAKYNKNLSEQRAKTVHSYLIAQGVEAERLTFKGYGMSKPIEGNDTKKGRAKNRRTELTIIDLD